MKLGVTLGATYLGSGQCRFRVWAPQAERVEVHLVTPQERLVEMQRGTRGYYHATLDGVEPSTRYRYRLNGDLERPDPASRYQPEDVHGPSEVVAADTAGQAPHWFGHPWQDYVIYELHVGTFTPEGTFDAIIPYLDDLRHLGITALELMPVAQFPGNRNWGYDGVYPFAVQSSYGGPAGLKRLVHACHQKGLAVILDVVYNHLGPEGNYLADFGPYFTERYQTPWGPALNFDGPHSDEVRRFFIENALYWMTVYHIDAFRLDAVHAIIDRSATPFLQELAAAVHAQAERLNRRVYVMAESDLDDTRIIRAPELGGMGHDAQWNDGFHHALHALLTGERDGYYRDFGRMAHLEKAFVEGYVYSGQYSVHRQRRHGNSSRAEPAHKFVVCAQNHDQVGNRLLGERLSRLVSFEALKLAAGIVFLSPFIPLLFMGEEYGETAPFQYFISHTDADLVEAVRRGRREEFAAFAWQGDAPDPQSNATFQQAKLSHPASNHGPSGVLRAFYKQLIHLRRTLPPLSQLSKETLQVSSYEREQVLCVRRWTEAEETCMICHFQHQPATITLDLPPGHWQKQLDSADEQWQGPGSRLPAYLPRQEAVTLWLLPQTVALFMRTKDHAQS